QPCFEFSICCFLRDCTFQYTNLKVFFQHNASVRKHRFHSVCWLSSVQQPFKSALIVDVDRSRICVWIVRSDFFDEASITWSSCISYNHVVDSHFPSTSSC